MPGTHVGGVVVLIGNEATVQARFAITFGVDCAPAHIGHNRAAERIKVISCFMALLSINVVGNKRILTEVAKQDN